MLVNYFSYSMLSLLFSYYWLKPIFEFVVFFSTGAYLDSKYLWVDAEWRDEKLSPLSKKNMKTKQVKRSSLHVPRPSNMHVAYPQ